MRFIAEIDVMPLKTLLDPQGKAVYMSMHNLGFDNVKNVRIGKHISVEMEASNKEKAGQLITELCRKILSNPVIEDFHYNINPL